MLEDFTKKVVKVPRYDIYYELCYDSSDKKCSKDSDRSCSCCSDSDCVSDISRSENLHYDNVFPDYHDPFACFDSFSASKLLLSEIKNIDEQNISIFSDNYVVPETLPELSHPPPVKNPCRFSLISDLASNRADEFIAISKGLDLSVSPRVALYYTEDMSEYFIPIQKDLKRLSEPMKWSLISICCDLGCTDANRQR